MMKRWMCMLLAAMLLGCGAAMATGSANGPAWNDRNTWVVYDGRLNCLLDDGTQMAFVVDYRSVSGDGEGLMCFWLAYEPEGWEIWEPLVWIQLEADVHGLVFDEKGGYRLLVEEEALQEAYETWLLFSGD